LKIPAGVWLSILDGNGVGNIIAKQYAIKTLPPEIHGGLK